LGQSDRLPDDVAECIATWKKAETQGYERFLFDKHQAENLFIRDLGNDTQTPITSAITRRCSRNYFRLCYILVEGGCFIDADDVFNGASIQYLCGDSRLKLHTSVYDLTTNTMVPPSLFTKPGANAAGWIFYFNMNPLIAGRGHPLIDRCACSRHANIEQEMSGGLPEIQSTAGPGNLTQSIFAAANRGGAREQNILVLHDWEQIATSKWPLSYRNDARNWRLSNGRAYQEPHAEDA